MAKKTKVSEATATDETTSSAMSQEDYASNISEVASDPSGMNGPDGTDTPESESGDAADAGSPAPVKPQEGISPTDAIPAEAETAPSSPDVEASASGVSSESSSQEATAGDTGANAGVSTGLTSVQVNDIMTKLLGVAVKEKREFIVYAPVRYNNRRYARGSKVVVDQDGHAELASSGLVAKDWTLGLVVEG